MTINENVTPEMILKAEENLRGSITISGTPLRRIAFGVLIGMLLYTLVMGLIGAAVAAILWGRISSGLNGDPATTDPGATSAPTTLSPECEEALVSKTDTYVCVYDDPAAVTARQAELGK